MGRGIIKRLLDGLKDTAAGLPDKRGASNGRKYGIADFVLGAFAVFYFQHPSMLNFQESMEQRAKRNNLRSLFGVETIPGEGVWVIREERRFLLGITLRNRPLLP
jgi:hypothetical protein